MIEIDSRFEDFAQGAVWQGKNARSRLAKIHRIWWSGDETRNVGYYVWDHNGLKDEREAWKVGLVRSEADFREVFQYAENHALNYAHERDKTKALMERVSSQLLDLSEHREAALGLLEAYATLVRREAGYQIALHDWDEGCVGVGCCADTADMGGDLLIDQNFLKAETIAEILGNDEES